MRKTNGCDYMIHSKVVKSMNEVENYNLIKFIFIDAHCVQTTIFAVQVLNHLAKYLSISTSTLQ